MTNQEPQIVSKSLPYDDDNSRDYQADRRAGKKGQEEGISKRPKTVRFQRDQPKKQLEFENIMIGEEEEQLEEEEEEEEEGEQQQEGEEEELEPIRPRKDKILPSQGQDSSGVDSESSDEEGNIIRKDAKVTFENAQDELYQSYKEVKKKQDLLRGARKRYRDGLDEPLVTPFNLNEELQEGSFNQEGMYIYQADQHRFHDQWLEGIDLEQIEKARIAQQHELDKREREMDTEKWGGGPLEWRRKLAQLLNQNETVLQCLKRSEKQQIDQITELCDLLMQEGELDIYQQTRRQILEDDSDFLKELDAASAQELERLEWEFQWEGSEEIHGPYSKQQLKDWEESGYFDQNGVKVRKMGEKWNPL